MWVFVGRVAHNTIVLEPPPLSGSSFGFVLGLLLFTLLTHDWTPTYSKNLKFADDVMVWLFCTTGVSWANISSGKITTNFFSMLGKLKVINGVEKVSSSSFLGIDISVDRSWTINTTPLAEKAQKHLYFYLYSLSWRRQVFPTPSCALFIFSCIRCGMVAARPLPVSQCSTNGSHPFNSHLPCKAISIGEDNFHPRHWQLSVLPLGRRHRSLQPTPKGRLANSFVLSNGQNAEHFAFPGFVCVCICNIKKVSISSEWIGHFELQQMQIVLQNNKRLEGTCPHNS